MIKLPNKLYQYSESVISKFSAILKAVEFRDVYVYELYLNLALIFSDINDFIDTLTCLYSLKIIELDNDTLKIKYYAKANNL